MAAVWTKELRRHKGRTVATAGAVAISMALLVSMLSISDGIIATVESSIADSGADLLVAAPYDTDFAGGHAIASNLTAWNDVENASPVLRALVRIDSGKDGTTPLSPVGLGVIPVDFYNILPPSDRDLISGWFKDPGDPHFAGGAYTGPFTGETVLSLELAEDLKVAVNDTVTVEGDAAVAPRTFTVVGTVATQLSGDRIIQEVRWAFFHLSELQEMRALAANGTGPNRTVLDMASRLYITLTNETKLAPGGASEVQRKVEQAYPDFAGMVQTKQDRLDRLQDEYAVARVFYVAIGFVSLVIGLLFVGCVVAISVSERTRDIGSLRAIGISRRSIFLMVLAESLVLVGVGALLGVLPGYFAAQALGDTLATSQGVAPTFVVFTPEVALYSVVRVVAFGLLVSLYPAWRATRVPVVEAMRAAL